MPSQAPLAWAWRQDSAMSGLNRSSSSSHADARITNMPLFHRYSPVSNIRRAVSASGFSTNRASSYASPAPRAAASASGAPLRTYPYATLGASGGTPKATMKPASPSRAADSTAAPNLSASSMAWSAGSASMSGSSPSSASAWSASAASVSVGAVLRPSGSSSMDFGGRAIRRVCSAARKRCSSLHTMTGGCAFGTPSSRATVS